MSFQSLKSSPCLTTLPSVVKEDSCQQQISRGRPLSDFSTDFPFFFQLKIRPQKKYKNDFIAGKTKLRAFIVSDSFSKLLGNIDSTRVKLAKKFYKMSKYREDCKDYSYCVKQIRTVPGSKGRATSLCRSGW